MCVIVESQLLAVSFVKRPVDSQAKFKKIIYMQVKGCLEILNILSNARELSGESLEANAVLDNDWVKNLPRIIMRNYFECG